jgi:pimeloyl-ACP methyl ester carboxylesterase
MSEELVEVGSGITLCYERFGEASDPPLLLIMGLGQQLIAWPEDLVQELVGRGFQVVTFDDRDIGRSTHPRLPIPHRPQFLTRRFAPEQYDLSDMARDTAGLIDALELRPTHVAGVSMGGMIAQMLAAEHPKHVRSLVSVMSSTGSRRAGWVAPSSLRLLFRPPPRDRDTAADRAVATFQHIGSHGFPFDEESVRDRARRAFDRDPRAAAGTARQLAAILKSGDRTEKLRRISAPTLVVHGDRDRMVHPSGGKATAAAITGARLVSVKGMGHDLPPGAKLGQLIGEHAQSVDRERAAV